MDDQAEDGVAHRERAERALVELARVHGALADAGTIIVDEQQLDEGVRALIRERDEALQSVREHREALRAAAETGGWIIAQLAEARAEAARWRSDAELRAQNTKHWQAKCARAEAQAARLAAALLRLSDVPCNSLMFSDGLRTCDPSDPCPPCGGRAAVAALTAAPQARELGEAVRRIMSHLRVLKSSQEPLTQQQIEEALAHPALKGWLP